MTFVLNYVNINFIISLKFWLTEAGNNNNNRKLQIQAASFV